MARKSQKEARIFQIMNATYQCILETSFEKTSLSQIAGIAGINQSVLYYFFKTKEDILLGFISFTLENYKMEFAEWMEKKTNTDSEASVLLKEIVNFFIYKTSDRNLTRVFVELWSLAKNSNTVRDRVKAVYNEAIHVSSFIIKGLGFTDSEARIKAMELMGFIEGAALMSILFDEKEYPVEEIMIRYRDEFIKDAPSA